MNRRFFHGGGGSGGKNDGIFTTEDTEDTEGTKLGSLVRRKIGVDGDGSGRGRLGEAFLPWRLFKIGFVCFFVQLDNSDYVSRCIAL